MKQAVHKALSMVMAILLLLSTISWKVEKHLCMGRVMDVAFFAKAEDCGMNAAMLAMDNNEIENHCCDDESITIQGQDDLKLSWNDLTIEDPAFFINSVTTYYQLYIGSIAQNRPLNTYPPPPKLVKDIQLLDQVFLI